MGAQVAGLVAGGTFVAAALILAGLGRWLAQRRTSRQRLARFAPIGAAPDSPSVHRMAILAASIVSFLRAHRRTAALGLLAVAVLVAVPSSEAVEKLSAVVAGLALLALWQFHKENARRREQLEDQLGPAVRSMAAAIASGHNLQQALARVANEAPPPIRDEFARLVGAAGLGASLETALGDMAARVRSDDVDFFATVVGIQFRLGGQLAPLLLGLADSVQERVEFRGQVRAMTAQGRYSGYVLLALPILVMAVVYSFNRPYLQPLLDTTIGRIMLGVAALMLLAGVVSIQRLSEVRA